MFIHTIDAAKRRHPQLRRCTCWDCLRAVGLTPPVMLRDKYPRRYPHTVFDGKDGFGEENNLGGDPGGVPRPNRKKGQKAEQKHASPAEAADRRHLKAAIRNREAI